VSSDPATDPVSRLSEFRIRGIAAPVAIAQDKMKKDGMKKEDTMSKDGMKKDARYDVEKWHEERRNEEIASYRS
jgi:hypothetical protein